MRGLAVAAVIVGLMVPLTVAGTAEGGIPPDPMHQFIGAWETDAGGTYQRLMIGGGPGDRLHLVYFHHNHPACGEEQAMGKGFAAPPDPMLEADLSVRCLKSQTQTDGWTAMLFYDEGRGLLVDELSGVEWKRQGQNMWHPSGH